MNIHSGEDWSDELKAQTRDLLEGREIAFGHDGRIALKHATSRFATIAEDDLRRGVLRVTDRRTGAETTFKNTDELIAAGWVID